MILTLVLYTITLLLRVCPDVLSLVGELLSGDGVVHRIAYTGCNRRNVPYFRRVFLMLNYTQKTQNTYIQS
jgi:hypothetical protein